MSSSKGKKPSAGGPTIRTLADISRGTPASPSAGSDSDDELQEFYTGGEKSGILVQDPSKANDVDAIFQQARQRGALEGPAQRQQPATSSSRLFSGTGRLLSGDTAPLAAQQPEQPQEQPASVTYSINFWTNGFSVNEGPLRRFDDPENASFLESIRNSVCPKELEPSDRRTMVYVNLIRRNEDYQEPEKPLLPFQGVGRLLGGGTASSSAASAPVPAPTLSSPEDASRPSSFAVDESLPQTSLQLRLADGTRVIARFNLHHTVADIRAFIEASTPGASYQLQTPGFPPTVLTDPMATIEQAGLKNSVIIQRM